jgi:S-adenosylmethionine:tRNA ribosyltransferase-isomerase
MDITARLETRGRVPLPPYITAPLGDKQRYQTVYARTPGSAAAPTAGLHFTPEMLARIEAMNIRIVRVRLDVGLGTFRPIRVENVAEHEMHSEKFAVSEEAADLINKCEGRVIAVGTTALRALETAALTAPEGKRVVSIEDGETTLFVYPGYTFRAVDALVTNFHQPHSTLLLLVAAFAGGDQMRIAYRTALSENYRFLSFGDAMFVH